MATADYACKPISIPTHRLSLQTYGPTIFDKDGLIEADRLTEVQRQEQAAKEARTARVNDLIKAFDEQSSAALRTVSSAATELDATAQSMSAIADRTSARPG